MVLTRRSSLSSYSSSQISPLKLKRQKTRSGSIQSPRAMSKRTSCEIKSAIPETDRTSDSTLDAFEKHVNNKDNKDQQKAIRRWLKKQKSKSSRKNKKKEQHDALCSARFHYYDQCSPTGYSSSSLTNSSSSD